VGPKLFMRSGVIISAVGHVAAVLLAVLFTGANPFDSVATEAIAVDIISPSEVPPDQPQAAAPEKTPEPARESPPEFNFELGMSTTPLPPTPPAPSPTTKPAQQAAQPRAKQQQSGRQPAAQAAASQAAAPQVAAPQGAAPQGAAKPPPPASPPPAAPPPPAAMQPPAAQEADKEANQPTTVADLFGMPLTLPGGRLGGGFDAPAYESAKIERGSVDAFRARLKTCAALPAGVSPGEKISLVVRVQLKPDGTLAGKPTLIEASASPKGPLLLQSLLGGLTKCQPYNMLPADKYQEWKSIDMRFTPNDMG
jgi:outer membrane biosynthesis protein TonB